MLLFDWLVLGIWISGSVIVRILWGVYLVLLYEVVILNFWGCLCGVKIIEMVFFLFLGELLFFFFVVILKLVGWSFFFVGEWLLLCYIGWLVVERVVLFCFSFCVLCFLFCEYLKFILVVCFSGFWLLLRCYFCCFLEVMCGCRK